MTHCLSDSEIADLLQAAMSPAELAAARAHVRECTECAERAKRAETAPLSAVHAAPTPLEAADEGGPLPLSDSGQSHWSDHSDPDVPALDAPYHPLGTPRVSLDEFLLGLSHSGLIPAEELATIRLRTQDDPALHTVSGLIEWLIRDQILTRYQAEQLARGQRGGLVLGNYIVLDKLGQGGMGAVFKARHRRMNRVVALKVLPHALSSLPEALARFQREVEAAARLQHPHIAAAYDADEAAGLHFLVMEYIDGPNLASFVKERGPLPTSVAVKLLLQAARGLAAAHTQGIIHRDVKPGNLIVTRQGILKILDMGLAQMRGPDGGADLTSDVTQTGRVMGTIDYLAPEQARDAKKVDARADIYSLGCTLFYLVTGRPPAPVGSAAEKLLWHQTQEVPKLSTLVPTAPPRLDVLLARMLAKKPDGRPGSMLAVAEALEQCASELPPADLSVLFGAASVTPGDPNSVTHIGSGYGQPTMAGTFGDTVISDPARRSPLFKSSGSVPRRMPIYVGLAAAAMMLLVAASVLWWRSGSATQAASGAATLVVAVDDGPADVLIDGNRRGSAGVPDGRPLELKVKPGKLLVQVQREGYQPFEEQVEVGQGPPVRVAATLKRADPLPSPAPPLSPHKHHEKLLAWVFQSGGQVGAVTSGGEQHLLSDRASLPSQPLIILSLKLDGAGIVDDDLARLADVPGLRELSLADTRVSDAGLKHLLPLKQLTRLDLSRTAVTNAGITSTISRLAELTELNLEQTKVTSGGMARLAAMPKLQRLFLSDTAVADPGFEQLRAARSLEMLTAHGTSLSDAAHARLTDALPRLDIAWDGADVERAIAMRLLEKGAALCVVDRTGQRIDNLRGASNLPPGRVSVREANLSTSGAFNDDDLAELSKLSEIESLTLAGTRVGAAGLAHLHGLKTLTKINLGNLSLPPAALALLRRNLPACQVLVRDQADAEVARQIVAAGGRVSIFTEQNRQIDDINLTANLPNGKYSLRSINLDDAVTLDDATLQKIGELQFLESLFLANTPLTDLGIERIVACKSITELGLGGTKVTAAGIAALGSLPQLSRLYVPRTLLAPDGLRQIGDLDGLTHLSLEGVPLADDDLTPLKRLERLEWLSVAGTPLTDSSLLHLQKLTHLRELNITATGLTDAGREELAVELGGKCRVIGDPFDPERLAARWLVEHAATVALESGRLASSQDLPRGACRVVAIDLASLSRLKREELRTHLAACTHVVALNLSETSLREPDLAFLQAMTSLRTLRLAKLSITDRVFDQLEGHAGLEILDLSETAVTGQGLPKLAAASGLKQILLSNTQVSDAHLAALELFPGLEDLDVSAVASLTDVGLKKIAALSNLRSLGLRQAKITDAGLKHLADLSELEKLDLDRAKVGDAGVASLAGLKKLRHLGLNGTQVTDAAASTLGQMKQLRTLVLGRTIVSPESIRFLQTELKGCSVTGPASAPRDLAAPAEFGPFGAPSLNTAPFNAAEGNGR